SPSPLRLSFFLRGFDSASQQEAISKKPHRGFGVRGSDPVLASDGGGSRVLGSETNIDWERLDEDKVPCHWCGSLYLVIAFNGCHFKLECKSTEVDVLVNNLFSSEKFHLGKISNWRNMIRGDYQIYMLHVNGLVTDTDV
ncbi:unnamed protein product, partial [Musa acuminata subsp. burmannicoides]